MMRTDIDLHTHSTASDGTLTPSQLVQRAAASGVKVLALTDHDTLAGIDEARTVAEQAGIRLIPGVEISISWQGHVVHMVALGVKTNSASLQRGLAALREHRDWRAREIACRLAHEGIPDAFEGASNHCRGQLVSRTHFARYLVELGKASDVRGIFRNYLVRGKPGYVAGEWASLRDAMQWVNEARGQAVIAHPARYRMTRSKLLRLLQEFKECGGQGIEVVSGSHSREDSLQMARIARQLSLRASAGSDYHGPENPWVELGKLPALPDGCQPIWRDWPDLAVPDSDQPAGRPDDGSGGAFAKH